MEQAEVSLNQIITETPYWSLVDLEEDERVFERFEFASARFFSKIAGQLYCEFDETRVQKQDVRRFLYMQESKYFEPSERQIELADLLNGGYGRFIQIKRRNIHSF